MEIATLEGERYKGRFEAQNEIGMIHADRGYSGQARVEGFWWSSGQAEIEDTRTQATYSFPFSTRKFEKRYNKNLSLEDLTIRFRERAESEEELREMQTPKGIDSILAYFISKATSTQRVSSIVLLH